MSLQPWDAYKARLICVNALHPCQRLPKAEGGDTQGTRFRSSFFEFPPAFPGWGDFLLIGLLRVVFPAFPSRLGAKGTGTFSTFFVANMCRSPSRLVHLNTSHRCAQQGMGFAASLPVAVEESLIKGYSIAIEKMLPAEVSWTRPQSEMVRELGNRAVSNVEVYQAAFVSEAPF